MATQAITVTSSGNNTVIDAGAGGIIIRQIVLQANALATIIFKAGTTALSGPMTFPSGGTLVVGDAVSTIWDLGTTNDFVINLGAGFIFNVGGWVVYDTY